MEVGSGCKGEPQWHEAVSDAVMPGPVMQAERPEVGSFVVIHDATTCN
jgi:hypothetical protein